MTKKQIEAKALKILDYEEHEFWKSSTPNVICHVYDALINRKFTPEEAQGLIQSLFSAVSNEYGN